MSEANRLYRKGLWDDFISELPRLVREFSYEEIDEAVRDSISDYMEDMEKFDVMGRENKKRRLKEIESDIKNREKIKNMEISYD